MLILKKYILNCLSILRQCRLCQFDFSDPPEIITPKNDTWDIMAGDTASIECHAKGVPSPQYVWTNAAGEIVSRGKHLRLHEVSYSDGGNYICNATNILGSASFTLTIQIKGPRKFFSQLLLNTVS